jgi:hypothetical protein
MKAIIRSAIVLATLSPVFAADVWAQQPAQPVASPVVQRLSAAKPEDVNSLDGIITALYASISGPKGQARDWNRMRSLFVPEARLIPSVNRQTGGRGVAVLSVNDYIATSGPFLVDTGFRELEVARKVETFGAVTHVFSTYESFRGDETAPFMRGINSIQLFNDGSRYWVLNIFWDSERPDQKIPDKYLKP